MRVFLCRFSRNARMISSVCFWYQTCLSQRPFLQNSQPFNILISPVPNYLNRTKNVENSEKLQKRPQVNLCFATPIFTKLAIAPCNYLTPHFNQLGHEIWTLQLDNHWSHCIKFHCYGADVIETRAGLIAFCNSSCKECHKNLTDDLVANTRSRAEAVSKYSALFFAF